MQRKILQPEQQCRHPWGKLQRAPLHPHALWVLKPVFQALHFFSEDTPVPMPSGKEAPDVITGGLGKGR